MTTRQLEAQPIRQFRRYPALPTIRRVLMDPSRAEYGASCAHRYAEATVPIGRLPILAGIHGVPPEVVQEYVRTPFLCNLRPPVTPTAIPSCSLNCHGYNLTPTAAPCDHSPVIASQRAA